MAGPRMGWRAGSRMKAVSQRRPGIISTCGAACGAPGALFAIGGNAAERYRFFLRNWCSGPAFAGRANARGQRPGSGSVRCESSTCRRSGSITPYRPPVPDEPRKYETLEGTANVECAVCKLDSTNPFSIELRLAHSFAWKNNKVYGER